jgi:peptidoglycan/xylan/chitin deacetylase (PgdA/CDA1 family)
MGRIGFLWPEALAGALTTSWDDGAPEDRRLVAILGEHGLKGTFNLNSSRIARAGKDNDDVREDEVVSLYAGHEVATHGHAHPYFTKLSDEEIGTDITVDRRELERITGSPVAGHALPFGDYDARVLAALRSSGIVYSRTVNATKAFALPGNFIEWHPTCHHKAKLGELWGSFLESREPAKLFYLWGHSYEFANNSNWHVIEAFASAAGAKESVWHATNMEIFEYVAAWRGLVRSVDGSRLRNPSATDVWATVEGEPHRVPAGESLA